MKVRKFIVELSTHEENLCGASFGHATTIGMAEFAPTVKNVRQAVKNFFPSREIDERDMTLAEQVQDSLEYGFFLRRSESSGLPGILQRIPDLHGGLKKPEKSGEGVKISLNFWI